MFNYEYKGLNFIGEASYNKEDSMFVGSLIGIVDDITFRGHTNEELEASFVNSVEGYVDFCIEEGELPNFAKTISTISDKLKDKKNEYIK